MRSKKPTGTSTNPVDSTGHRSASAVEVQKALADLKNTREALARVDNELPITVPIAVGDGARIGESLSSTDPGPGTA